MTIISLRDGKKDKERKRQRKKERDRKKRPVNKKREQEQEKKEEFAYWITHPATTSTSLLFCQFLTLTKHFTCLHAAGGT